MPELIKYVAGFRWYSGIGLCFWWIFTASCGRPIVSKAPKDTYFLYRNSIEVKGGNFTKTEKTDLLLRLNAQLDDSAKVKTKKKFFFFNALKRPNTYDSNISRNTCNDMKASLFHAGYFQSEVKFSTDTSKKRVTVTYSAFPGKPTMIDTLRYSLRIPEMQQLALQSKRQSYLKEGERFSKNAVLSEINRLVDSFRNNGYYKFTPSELKVRGDTSIEALTAISNDPFEQLQLLAEAAQRRDSPQIKLAVVIKTPRDSTRLNKYFINKIIIYPDFRQGENPYDTTGLNELATQQFTIRYHEAIFKQQLFARNIILQPGMIFKQYEYYKTLSNLTKAGVWQSVNVQIVDLQGSDSLINIIFELTPNKKFGFEAALEVSYSASSNTSNILAGNLFGISGNLSLTNRNLAKEAIRMTHNIRAGVELNNNNRGANSKLVNSNEVSYGNSTFFPRLIFPVIPTAFNKKSDKTSGETYINLALAYNTRLNLFNLQSVNANFGWTGINKRNWKWSWTFFNLGFSYLFNESDSFKTILDQNPFLQYSYNTALVNGMGITFSKTIGNLKHFRSKSREFTKRFNFEESGLTWGLLPILNKYKRRYVKAESEFKYSISYNKTSLAFHGILGIGIPLLGSDTNRTLPFFKQYFQGGSNSMRAWPVRGIGPGGRPLVPFSSTTTIFNDRTGDMQIEANIEYRYDIARIIPNTLTLRGALFADIGNIWNLRNTKTDGTTDTAQFKFSNLYSQLGVAAGTGFRLDFNYFVLRLDFGFRFKRPDLYYDNNGWKKPDIGFDDFLKKIFTRGNNDEYRKWRYENFNFTIGIGYSF